MNDLWGYLLTDLWSYLQSDLWIYVIPVAIAAACGWGIWHTAKAKDEDIAD